ncbi:MAG: hypothetical protein GY953_08915 [bacterium]|nr:hypothetical protein [bacterium]
MKTAVSIPDLIFERGERLAHRLSKTRSQLYAEAIDEYATRHDPNTVTDCLNAVVDSLAEAEDRFVSDTTNSILSQVKW